MNRRDAGRSAPATAPSRPRACPNAAAAPLRLNALGWLIATASLSWSTAAGPALAQDEPSSPPDVARAESYAAEAFQAYAEKDYPRAVALYQQALDAAPSADIVYNIARIYDTKLEDAAHAE